jgi:hypothetical protein
MLAGRWTGSDRMFLHRNWLQKLSVKRQGPGGQREPGRNVSASIPRSRPLEAWNAECWRLGAVRCGVAAVDDGKPPAVSSSERAGSERHVVTSGIRPSSGTWNFSIVTRGTK